MKILNKLYGYYRQYDGLEDPKRFFVFMGGMVPIVWMTVSDCWLLSIIGVILILFFGITRVTYLNNR